MWTAEVEAEEKDNLVSEIDGSPSSSGASQEVRRAHRRATVALLLSGGTFVLALVNFASRALTFVSSPPAPTAIVTGESSIPSVVGLHEDIPWSPEMGFPGLGPAQHRATFDEDEGPLPMPARYRLLVPAGLHAHVGRSTNVVQKLPEGAQVFMLKHQLDWVQVLVAKGPGVTPAFGWLPLQEDGKELLQKDAFKPEQDHLPSSLTAGGGSMDPEEVAKRWGEVKDHNQKLKQSLSRLQESLRSKIAGRVQQEAGHKAAPGDAGSKPGRESILAEKPDLKALSKAAEGTVDVQALKADASAWKVQVKKELKEPPQKLLKDLGSLFH